MQNNLPLKLATTREAGYPRGCELCEPDLKFYDAADFGRHLRLTHSKREGGSFVCCYGPNRVCQKLPLEGVSDFDYEAHIRRFHTAPNSTMSRSPVVEEEKEKPFTINSFTQNLSSVLSDPSRSRSEVNAFFTRHWGDTFVPTQERPKCTHLPPLEIDFFQKYVKDTAKTCKKYSQAKQALRRLATHQLSRTETDDLPVIFLDKSFQLAHADTFSSVFIVPREGETDQLSVCVRTPRPDPLRRDETCASKNPGEFRDYDALQSRLEAMHDVVDCRLADKLVTKKDAFWQIVNSYGSLHEELADGIGQIKSVRGNLSNVSTLICDRSKKVIQLYEKIEQKEKLKNKLKDISCIRAAQSTVQMLLSQGEYPRALECIETSLDVLNTELNGVVCFRHLGSQLKELYEVIGRMMREDFATLIQKEFGTKVEEAGQIALEGELSGVIAGLIRMSRFSFTLVLRNEIEEAVKNILRQAVKQRVVSSGIDLAQFDPSLQNLGESVRRLKFAEWLRVLDDVMDALFAFNLRIQTLQEMILELADRVEAVVDSSVEREVTPESCIPLDIQRDSSPEPDLDDFGGSSDTAQSLPLFASQSSSSAMLAVEIRSSAQLRVAIAALSQYANQCAQLRICRLLQARTKDSSASSFPSPSELSLVLSAVRGYQVKCAAKSWCKAPSEGLRGGGSSPLELCSHRVAIAFIDRFHKDKRTRIGDVLDQELWKSTEVPSVFQRLVDESMERGRLCMVDEGVESADSADSLRIEEREYVVVGSALVVVRAVAEYCECLRILPSFAKDILLRIIEILKAFNSRSCQLILGAGALQLVGLKTISVRNLALSSRSLQLVMHFIGMVKREFEILLPAEEHNLLRHFNQVNSDYRDHINELTGKLASVIDHNIMNSLEGWKIKGSIPSDAFAAICRNLVKFHNGMAGIMPEEQIMTLFSTVNVQFKDHLKLRLAQMKVSPHDSLTWGIVSQDYAFYTNSVRSMSSCKEMVFESLNEVIYGK